MPTWRCASCAVAVSVADKTALDRAQWTVLPAHVAYGEGVLCPACAPQAAPLLEHAPDSHTPLIVRRV